MGILTVLLLSILYTSVIIYPPFVFISHPTSQEKVISIERLFMPSIIVMSCVLLEYMLNRKPSILTTIMIVVSLCFNIVSRIIINNVDITYAVYIISGINFNLIPICLMLLLRDNLKLKLSSALLKVSSVLLIILCIILIITFCIGSYIFVLGLMYLSLLAIIITNCIMYFNSTMKIYKLRTVIVMYAFNFIFTLFNVIWYIGDWVIVGLGVISIGTVVVLTAFMIYDTKKIANNQKKSCNLE